MNKRELIKIIKEAEANGLIELDLSGQNIKELPKEIGNLTKLRSLNLLGNNKLASLPSELGNLSSLEELNLSGTKLSSSLSSID